MNLVGSALKKVLYLWLKLDDVKEELIMMITELSDSDKTRAILKLRVV